MNSVDITPTKGFPHMYDFVGDKVTSGSPIVLIVLTFVIIVYYILFSYLGVSATGAVAQAPPTSLGITFLDFRSSSLVGQSFFGSIPQRLVSPGYSALIPAIITSLSAIAFSLFSFRFIYKHNNCTSFVVKHQYKGL